MKISIMLMFVGFAAFAGLGGCHSPSGGVFPSTWGSQTWYSTEDSPKSVKLVDTRSGEELFAIDIPVGKQLTMNFDKDGGDDAVNSPDLMLYEVMEKGSRIGSLHNSMSVPNSHSRRIDMFIRRAPEYAGAAAQRQLRTDETADRPDWWTPKGGPMPENKSKTLYDN